MRKFVTIFAGMHREHKTRPVNTAFPDSRRRAPQWPTLACAAAAIFCGPDAGASQYDVVIRGGAIFDGSGGAPFTGDIAISGDRIAYVGPRASSSGATLIDAHGLAVAPGFINMLSQANETLLIDGRALSDLRQGVTLEVLGEGESMGPTTPALRDIDESRQGSLRYRIDWDTLGEYLSTLESRGVSPNVASYIGAGTVRRIVLGEDDVDPTPSELARMRALVREAMEEGALGVSTALIYAPSGYAKTPEISALAAEAGRCGGLYLSHIRSEGDRLLDAVDETIALAKQSGAPAEIFHLKVAGASNWRKLAPVIQRIEKARAAGVRVAADMYVYTAASTGFDAAMPTWVQDGGPEAWIARLKDPAIRQRVIAEMRDPRPAWESLYRHAGPEGTRLVAFKNPGLRPLIGKTLAEVAAARGVSAEDAIIDLVIEDGSRVQVVYFMMSEENVRRQIALPWMGFISDDLALAPEGVFREFNRHPRAYGAFARLLAKYVREEKLLGLAEAVRRLTALPAAKLALQERGALRPGFFADIVVFDPASIQDHATHTDPHRFATGVRDVIVNGRFALKDGEPTGERPGRFVRGRAWTGKSGGGCRATSADWTWPDAPQRAP